MRPSESKLRNFLYGNWILMFSYANHFTLKIAFGIRISGWTKIKMEKCLI